MQRPKRGSKEPIPSVVADELKANEEIEELRWIGSDCPRSDLSVTSAIVLEDLKSKDLID